MANDSDFLERNSAFFLSVVAMCGAMFGALLQYLRASRCTSLRCCGAECQRDVLPPDAATLDTNALNR
jgi:hypothetical protein